MRYTLYKSTQIDKARGANMGHMSAPDGPHVGPMNLAIMVNISINA